MNGFAFDPLIALPLIITFAVVMGVAAVLTGLGGLRSMLGRLIAALAVTLAFLNPQKVNEERQTLPDVALIITDKSESMGLGGREALADETRDALRTSLQALDNVEIVEVEVLPDADGTRLGRALIEGVSTLPAGRIGGIFAITDGQIHDLPSEPARLLPEGIPFHSLIVGDPEGRDRRITPSIAPRYALVDERVNFEVQVDDPGHEGERANIEIRLNGEPQARFPAVIGNTISIPLKVERRGTNTVELIVEAAPGEITLLNNVFVAEVSGLRDRLRVLLVTGYPHSGARSWRNLLKSDPSVDLVQFTILTGGRSIGKDSNAAAEELSLIAFPRQELFEDKLEEFDLIIFDQYERRRDRSQITPYQFSNIVDYVEGGGALLVAAGPAYAGTNSLHRTPLAAVLPTRPTGELVIEPFKAKLTEQGRRHPITAAFEGQTEQSWGRWFRAVEGRAAGGNELMSGPNDIPLLVVDKIGEGRTALLMSDQAWLWARGFEGGGPYNELFRRLSHWLMGEPDLEAEKLEASITGDTLTIERRSLGNTPGSVLVERPDGTEATIALKQVSPGVFQGSEPIGAPGAYRVSTQELSAIAAAGALNPTEFSKLLPDPTALEPLSSASGGGIYSVASSDTILSELRRVKPGRTYASENWAGVIDNGAYDVTASRRDPLAPTLLYFLLAAFGLGFAWIREGQ